MDREKLAAVVNGTHLAHIIHFLLHEWKVGGVLALIGAGVGFLLVGAPMSIPSDCTTTLGGEVCYGSSPYPEGIVKHLGGAAVGGFFGAVAAAILVYVFKVKEGTLGIPGD